MKTTELYLLLPPGYELIEDDHMIYLYKGKEVIASFTVHITQSLLNTLVKNIIKSERAK
jgi:hypothetical protein